MKLLIHRELEKLRDFSQLHLQACLGLMSTGNILRLTKVHVKTIQWFSKTAHVHIRIGFSQSQSRYFVKYIF